MKAAVWHAQRDVRVDEVPEPPPASPGQAKVEIAWCGICGTDLHEYLGGPLYIPADTPHPLTGVRAPIILGHETTGKVVEVGPGVNRVKVGDRVVICPIIGCLECHWCMSGVMGLCPRSAYLGSSWHGGGFSRYVNVYDYMCYKLPPTVSDELAAMVEPFAATVRAVARAEIKPGEMVAVVGAGPVGLMAMQAARHAGAGELIVFEPAAKRRKVALQCGATAVVDPVGQNPLEEIRKLTRGAGADLVMECAGVAEAGVLAGRVARRRGRVMVMGVHERPHPLDYTDLVFGEKTIMGSMGGYGMFDQAIQMVAEGKFKGEALITARIGLAEIVSAGFDPLIKHKDEHVKILVSPLG